MPSRRARWNATFRVLSLLALLSASLILIVLLTTLVRKGWPYLNLEFFQNFPSRRPSRAGIKAALFGSLYVVGIASAVAVPVGVAAAVYLEEFNTRKTRFTHFLQVNIANLSGVPSIIYGLLGLGVFVRALSMGFSVVAGALTLALLILPTIILVSQEALRAVPKSYRDASAALGVSPWGTIRHQVLPSAMSGIITGIILSVSRALGTRSGTLAWLRVAASPAASSSRRRASSAAALANASRRRAASSASAAGSTGKLSCSSRVSR
jgi:phosphate transport system permease protein